MTKHDETRTTNFCFCFNSYFFFPFLPLKKKPLTLFRFFFWRLQIYNQLTYAACDFIASSQYVFCVSLFFKFMPTYLLNILIIVKTFLHNFVETFSLTAHNLKLLCYLPRGFNILCISRINLNLKASHSQHLYRYSSVHS